MVSSCLAWKLAWQSVCLCWCKNCLSRGGLVTVSPLFSHQKFPFINMLMRTLVTYLCKSYVSGTGQDVPSTLITWYRKGTFSKFPVFDQIKWVRLPDIALQSKCIVVIWRSLCAYSYILSTRHLILLSYLSYKTLQQVPEPVYRSLI